MSLHYSQIFFFCFSNVSKQIHNSAFFIYLLFIVYLMNLYNLNHVFWLDEISGISLCRINLEKYISFFIYTFCESSIVVIECNRCCILLWWITSLYVSQYWIYQVHKTQNSPHQKLNIEYYRLERLLEYVNEWIFNVNVWFLLQKKDLP